MSGWSSSTARAGDCRRCSARPRRGRGVIGLIVDSALELVALPEGGLEPLPPGVSAEAAAVLDGITVVDGAPVAVLSPPGLLGLRSRLPGAA